ncbi:solute carrier family 35 member E2B-like isoform X2 [Pollicipes pollicipes]|nr:solute carrier family 35 member E2B-like isoform X2 [Pollicipes pollicipes]
MLGLALCSSNELSFDIRGFSAAICTNLAECCQNVYSKLLISGEKYKYTPTELQFYTSLSSVLVQLPVSYLLVGPEQLSTLQPQLLSALALNGLSFHMQSFTAYVLMGYISPVTYSVANTVKRALLIWFSVLIFGNAVSVLSGVGTATVLLGVLCYNRAQEWAAARGRRASLAAGPTDGVAVQL